MAMFIESTQNQVCVNIYSVEHSSKTNRQNIINALTHQFIFSKYIFILQHIQNNNKTGKVVE